MKDATLALVELANPDEVSAELGVTSLEIFLSEFQSRVAEFKRANDEIVTVLPHKLCVWLRNVCDPSQIELAGAKLVRLLEVPICVVDEEIRPQFHAAFVPPSAQFADVKERLKVAEQGLRDARSRNVPFVIRGAADARRQEDDFKRIREVERALHQGEFALYFQPQINAAYRNITGAEALMRWHRPGHGVVPPGEFISHAQRGGLLADLTWFAIKSAVAQCRRWPEQVAVAVNIPPAVLLDDQLEHVVKDALAIFSLDPARLTLEMTEDAMIDQPQRVMEIMGRLRELGVKLAIDDFGTGYSSLAYLRRLPLDELKVDRSFVRDMVREQKDRGIVKAIVDLAHNFDLKVVAEGVEDASAADALQRMGCDTLQGYFFGKPMPVDEFIRELNAL